MGKKKKKWFEKEKKKIGLILPKNCGIFSNDLDKVELKCAKFQSITLSGVNKVCCLFVWLRQEVDEGYLQRVELELVLEELINELEFLKQAYQEVSLSQ